MRLRILKKAGKLFKLRPIWKKLRREKDILTHLIVYEGLYKYNIAFFKKCSETQNFESKLIVAIVAENPSAYDFAPYPSCLGFFHKKTMYWHETDCSEWKDRLSNTGKNIKAAAFALMLEVKLPKTPHLNNMFSHERDMMNMGILQGVILWYDTLASGTLIREKLTRVTFKSTTEWEKWSSLYINSIAQTWLKSLIPKCGQGWKKLLPFEADYDYWRTLIHFQKWHHNFPLLCFCFEV